MSLIYTNAPGAALFWSVYAAVIGVDARLVLESLSGRAARAESAARGPVHRPTGLVALLVAEALALVAAAADVAQLPWRWPLLVAGVSLAWLGLALRLAAKRALGRFFVGAIVIQERHEVVTTGPYTLIRHPGYAGAIVGLAGLGIATGSLVSAALLTVAPILVFTRTITVEEATLVTRLGEDYHDYQRRTSRLIPRLW